MIKRKSIIVLAALLIALSFIVLDAGGQRTTIVHQMMLTCEGDNFSVVSVIFQPRSPGFKQVDFWLRKYDAEAKIFRLEPVLNTGLNVRSDSDAPRILLKVGGVVSCKVWARVIAVGPVEEK